MRSGPKRSCSPLVTVKMPPAAPTSMPISTTELSRSIASAMPALTASRYLTGSVAVDMLVGLFDIGQIRTTRELHRGFDRRAHLQVECRQRRFALKLGGHQARRGQGDRIAIAPPGCLLAGLVRLRVTFVVSVPSVGLSFDERGAATA